MEISAQNVKALREKTDAPMMECKKALQEAHGDINKAEDLLRVRLGNKARKAAGRLASEGVVAASVSPDGRKGTLIELNCETDFVAKNADFLSFATQLAEFVWQKNPPDVVTLSKLSLGDATVEDRRVALVGKIGENISIRRFVRFGGEGKITSYIHGGARVGVLLEMEGGDAALAKDLTLHIAAAKPQALHAGDLPAELVAHEKELAMQKALQGGDVPADRLEKIVGGQVNKFMQEVVLQSQPFVKDPKMDITRLLQSHKARIIRFALYQVGEGLEKKDNSNFSHEVAAQVAQARQHQA